MAGHDYVFISDPPTPPDGDPLDAYSRAVTFVAEKLSPSVANLRVSQRVRGGRVLGGAGSGVVITADGFMLTSAHVVAGSEGRGRASFSDGQALDFEVVGADPLGDRRRRLGAWPVAPDALGRRGAPDRRRHPDGRGSQPRQLRRRTRRRARL